MKKKVLFVFGFVLIVFMLNIILAVQDSCLVSTYTQYMWPTTGCTSDACCKTVCNARYFSSCSTYSISTIGSWDSTRRLIGFSSGLGCWPPIYTTSEIYNLCCNTRDFGYRISYDGGTGKLTCKCGNLKTTPPDRISLIKSQVIQSYRKVTCNVFSKLDKIKYFCMNHFTPNLQYYQSS